MRECFICAAILLKTKKKMISVILMKYVGEMSFQTMLKGMMNEDVYSVAVPVIQFITFTSFACFRVLFKGLFIL